MRKTSIVLLNDFYLRENKVIKPSSGAAKYYS